MADQISRQKRFPRFTMLSILTTAMVLAVMFGMVFAHPSGFEGLGTIFMGILLMGGAFASIWCGACWR